ncbi:hypothetical protein HanPI659440_Chr01g0004091 [Helianthus annuus]|nr:hypothetical protein HanHA89_Chr01g0004251 [Helianthus annuus]KAJ0808503.1 hypothetical protein HanPI659440_Chr01g0004091 [Helianthus annuus]
MVEFSKFVTYEETDCVWFLMHDVGILQQGRTIHIGDLMRLDLNQASVQKIYFTVWASSNVSLHLGKFENADEIWNKQAGVRLQPPIGVDRLSELGKWESREVKVSGTSWDVNSVDLYRLRVFVGFLWV